MSSSAALTLSLARAWDALEASPGVSSSTGIALLFFSAASGKTLGLGNLFVQS